MLRTTYLADMKLQELGGQIRSRSFYDGFMFLLANFVVSNAENRRLASLDFSSMNGRPAVVESKMQELIRMKGMKALVEDLEKSGIKFKAPLRNDDPAK